MARWSRVGLLTMGQCRGRLGAVKAADIILIFHVPFFTKWLKEALRLVEESADTLPFFHRGGWTKGCKEWMAFMAPGLNAGGVNLVSAGYRLAPGHVFPTGLEDCMAAVLQGTRGRVFVGGHSASGHDAALLALGPGGGLPAACLSRACLSLAKARACHRGRVF